MIHEERVERHCAGIEEIIENMKKNFVTMQEKLVEMGERNKIQLHNLEMAFINANKSIKFEKILTNKPEIRVLITNIIVIKDHITSRTA